MPPSSPSLASRVADIVFGHKPDLGHFEALYRTLHQGAELSTCENQTADLVASALADMGFRVERHLGGTGVAGVLSSGEGGTTVLLRAELDGLPIKEETGLPYASTRRMADSWGRDQPTMHACGHDLHMACLLATAALLHDARAEWNGTVIVVFQPNEEHTGGAQAMVDGGLYNRVPVPDVVLGQHSGPFKAGTLNVRAGPVLVSADTMRIRLFSSLGHAANPQVNIDPVKLASNIIVKLDDLAKEIAGDEYAYIGVDEIHAGYPGQDWVSHADLTLDVKAYNPTIRQTLLDRITVLVKEEWANSGAKNSPEISVSVGAPLTENSPTHSAAIRRTFASFFGDSILGDALPRHPCEDFSRLAAAHDTPYVFWFFGREDPQAFDDAILTGTFLDKIPINHSPFNSPTLHPTLEFGTEALALAALTFLVGEE